MFLSTLHVVFNFDEGLKDTYLEKEHHFMVKIKGNSFTININRTRFAVNLMEDSFRIWGFEPVTL